MLGDPATRVIRRWTQRKARQPDSCKRSTPGGGELRVVDVPMVNGGTAPACVQYCPQQVAIAKDPAVPTVIATTVIEPKKPAVPTVIATTFVEPRKPAVPTVIATPFVEPKKSAVPTVIASPYVEPEKRATGQRPR